MNLIELPTYYRILKKMTSSRKSVQIVEASQLKKDIAEFSQGDTVLVDYLVREGSKERFQPYEGCLLYTSPSPRDREKSRMPSSA